VRCVGHTDVTETNLVCNRDVAYLVRILPGNGISWLGLKYFFLVPKDESSDSTLKEDTTMPFPVHSYSSTKVLRTAIEMASSVHLSVNL
jgi:hypothetical protein